MSLTIQHVTLPAHMTCHCIIVLQSMFVPLELDTLFYYVISRTYYFSIHYFCTRIICLAQCYRCIIVYVSLDFLIFVFASLYLHDWAMSLWSCTRVFACACHLILFYVLASCFLTTLDLYVQISDFGLWWPFPWRSEWRSGSVVIGRMSGAIFSKPLLLGSQDPLL